MIWNSAKHALPLRGRIRMNLVKLSRSNRISFDIFFVTLSHHDIDLPHEPPSKWKPMLTLHEHVKEEPNWDFLDVTNISLPPFLRDLFLHFCHASKRNKKGEKKGMHNHNFFSLFLFYRARKPEGRGGGQEDHMESWVSPFGTSVGCSLSRSHTPRQCALLACPALHPSLISQTVLP